MEPQSMVKARGHDVRIGHALAMGDHRAVEQRHVRGIGEHGRVGRRIIREAAGGAEPEVMRARLLSTIEEAGGVHRTHLDRAFATPIGRPARRQAVEIELLQVCLGWQVIRARHLRHRRLMMQAGFLRVIGGGHREDRLALLDRQDAPRGETAPVADAFDFVDDGNGRVATEQEIAMQRMRPAPLHRAIRRDQGLRDHLPAINAFPAHERGMPAEEVYLKPFKIENREKRFDRCHARSGQRVRKVFCASRLCCVKSPVPPGWQRPPRALGQTGRRHGHV